MAKIDVQLGSEDTADETPPLKEMTDSLPSVSKAKKDGFKYAERVQFSFTNVPKPIKLMFAKEAQLRGITQKEFLYHCLRAGGLDIPDAPDIDGRRR